MGQRQVVGRPVGLLHDHGLAAHLHHERLGHGQHHGVRGHAEHAVLQPGDVEAQPRERHGRVDRQGDRPVRAHRLHHPHPVAAGGVHEQVAGLHVARGGQAGHELAQRVVRDGEDDHLGAAQDLGDLQDGHARQEHLRAVPRGLGDGVHARDRVARSPQRRAQHGPHSTRAHHADAQPPGPLRRVMRVQAQVESAGHRSSSPRTAGTSAPLSSPTTAPPPTPARASSRRPTSVAATSRVRCSKRASSSGRIH